jgi:hypothetical protein
MPRLRGTPQRQGARRGPRSWAPAGPLWVHGSSLPRMAQQLALCLKSDEPLPVGRACGAVVRIQVRKRRRPPFVQRHGGNHEYATPSGTTERSLRLFCGELCSAVLRQAQGGNPQQPVLGPRTEVTRPPQDVGKLQNATSWLWSPRGSSTSTTRSGTSEASRPTQRSPPDLIYTLLDETSVKSRLSIAATQQQVRFSRLHEKRATVIAEMYSALQELIEVVQGFITDQGSSHDSRSESYKKIQEAARKFSGLCREKRLFVPRGTADKLEDIEQNIKYAANIRMLTDVDQQRGFQLTNFEEYSSQAIRELRRIAQEPLVELEDEFRRLLGEETHG